MRGAPGGVVTTAYSAFSQPEFDPKAAPFVELNCGREHVIVERPSVDRIDLPRPPIDHTFVLRDGVYECVRHRRAS